MRVLMLLYCVGYGASLDGEAEDKCTPMCLGMLREEKRRGVLVSAASALKEMETFVRAQR